VAHAIPLSIRLAVLQRAGYCCEDCGRATRGRGCFPGFLELHHKVRLEDGGTHNIENLAARPQPAAHTRVEA